MFGNRGRNAMNDRVKAWQCNGWNRLNIAFRTPAGTYQPGQLEKLKKSA
jgi:hypothetical protein